MSSDVRLGGRWSALQRRKNDALWLLASLAIASLRPAPEALLRGMGRLVGVGAHAFLKQAREKARANVALVYPTMNEGDRAALVRECFATLGALLGDTLALLRPTRAPTRVLPLSDEARAVFDEARAEGRGVVFASAHLGPWERVAVSLVAAGVPLVALARESYDPRFSRLYERLRSRHGVAVVWRASPGAATRIVRTLRRGGVLGMPMDLRSRVTSLDVPFLGHVAPTPAGPARIALRARAPVVVGTVAPLQGGSEELHVTAARIDTSDSEQDDDSVRTLTTRINSELSRRILALPHAWVWMHDRWGRAL